MNNNELKIMIPNGWGVIEEVLVDGSRVLTLKSDTATADNTACNEKAGTFKKVPASELRLDDEFLKYCPKTEKEKKFKKRVKNAIESGLKDFWRPVCDPSFDDKRGICFESGKKPAVGYSYSWWAKTAKEFKPEQGSRLGTETEYIAFLAVLIKELVNSGKSVEWAWNAVCNDSEELGNYWNSQNAKHEFEDTGRREICGFFDLANTYKILADDEDGNICLAGLFCDYYGFYLPIAGLWYHKNPYTAIVYGCGWLVLTEGCTDH